jgi:hypothetical protein
MARTIGLRRGLIVHIDPNTNDVHAVSHGRRSRDSILGALKTDEHGRHAVHIGRDIIPLAHDPRLQNGRVVEEGPYLLIYPESETPP